MLNLSWMHQHPEEGGQISKVHQEQLSIPAERSPSHLFSPSGEPQELTGCAPVQNSLSCAKLRHDGDPSASHLLHHQLHPRAPEPLPSEQRHGNLQKIKGGKSPASLRELICRVCSKGSFHAQLSPHSFAEVSRARLRSEKRQRSYQTIHLLSMSFLNCKNR